MDKQKQKAVAVVIGLIIALLVILVGIRIIQKRKAQATAPDNLRCIVSGVEGKVTWSSADADPGLVMYGTTSQESGEELPFLAEETTAAKPSGNGMYEHSVIISPLLESSDYSVSINGYPETVVPCSRETVQNEPVNGGVEPDQTAFLPSKAPLPTEEPSPTEEEEEDEETDVTIFTTLESNEFTSYYNDNTSASILDCVKHFANETDEDGNSYIGLSNGCVSAWTQVNLSESSE